MLTKNPNRSRPTFTDQEALLFHSQGRPGKLEVIATKPMATQRDLSLAYSPGVAVPVLAIAEDESKAYDYTVKGNFVAVITNGTAILGLGNRGALASKPVMEGKAVPFKRFADIDPIDLQVNNQDTAAIILCDTKGVVYKGRTEGTNQWKSAHAVETKARTLRQAFEGADVAFGLSAKGAFTVDMVKSMADKPIIFAMANPDPEITVEEVAEVRADAIMATGRSDYPNQVNNVLGFPYIFRGALDVRATTINMEMKIAAARALPELAREDVPDEVAAAYGARPKFGPDYIIPVPFDPRLISYVPPAVAKAAMDTGVARKPIAVYAAYLYERLQRKGFLQRDCQRLVNQDRNHFAACMVALNDADAMVTGVTRNFSGVLADVGHCIDPKPGHRVMGVSLVIA